jgi:hypothetical protein
MSAVALDPATVAPVLISSETVAAAASRLKVGRQRLKAFCVADDVLRPLFYKLADRGRQRVKLGMKRLRWAEADGG